MANVAVDGQGAVGEVGLTANGEFENVAIACQYPIRMVIVPVVAIGCLAAIAATLEQATLQDLQRDAAFVLRQRLRVELIKQQWLAKLMVLKRWAGSTAILNEF